MHSQLRYLFTTLLVILVAGCTPLETNWSPPVEFGVGPNPGGEIDHLTEDEALAKERALDWLDDPDNGTLTGIDALETVEVVIDSLDMAHIRLDQFEGDMPVFGGQLIVHMSPSGDIASVTDGLVRSIDVDTTPELSVDDALDVAIYNHPDSNIEHDADLLVLRHDSVDHLVYRVLLEDLETSDPTMPVVFVDAHDGAIVLSYDDLQDSRDRETYSADNTLNLPGTLKRSEADAATGDTQVDEAHNFMGEVYDYFKAEHGRDSYDGLGATIVSTVHYDNDLDNAFWDSRRRQFVFGDGDILTAMTGGLDIIGHEFAHAVTSKSARLIYREESGGLNEATSDIFGAAIEAWVDGGVNGDTWKVGEDITTPSWGAAVRYMDNPTADGMSIDHYSDYVRGMDVHYSSGIANKAFYLMVQDSSLSISQAAGIWYRALTRYMVPNTHYRMARKGTIHAADDLFGEGSAQSRAVADAWTAVGVLEGGTCEAAATLSGWTDVSGDNGGTGATNGVDFYPSEVAVGNYTGPEIAYKWTSPISGEAEFSLVDPEPTAVNHDIFILLPTSDGKCNASEAKKRGFNSMKFEVQSGQEYFIVVDGFNGDVGPFTLRFEEG